jgi:hypothetical protein
VRARVEIEAVRNRRRHGDLRRRPDPAEPIGDLHIRLVSAHTEAYLPVPAKYEELPLILHVYDAVEAWTDARPGIKCTGHPYEIYPGTNARFDVAYPVAD